MAVDRAATRGRWRAVRVLASGGLALLLLAILPWPPLTAVLPVGNLPAAANAQTAAAALSVPPHTRHYQLGLGYVTGSRAPSLTVPAAYARIAGAADVAYMQRTWDQWLPATTADDPEVAAARQDGLKLYFALDVLSYANPPRGTVSVPPSLGISGDFTSPDVQRAYLNLVDTLASRYSPDYFILLVEANLHKQRNLASYQAYQSLYLKAYQDVKRLSPNTKISVSLVYADALPPPGLGPEDKQLLQSAIPDWESNTDMLAISTYPFFFIRPQAIPDNFLSELASWSTHPLFISETSWSSRGFIVTNPNGPNLPFSATEQDQSNFVARLAQLTRIAQDQGHAIEAVNFLSLQDPAVAPCQAATAGTGFEWFCFLGLTNADGTPKPAYNQLQAWHALPLAPAFTPTPTPAPATPTPKPLPTQTPVPAPSDSLAQPDDAPSADLAPDAVAPADQGDAAVDSAPEQGDTGGNADPVQSTDSVDLTPAE